MATGDVLLHPDLWDQARRDARVPGTMDFGPQLAGVRSLVSAADLAICHLETPLAAPGGPFRGYPQFAAPPQIVDALKRTGYDACTTASNHSFDGGAAGIARSLDALDRAGLAHAGTARSRNEAGATTIVDVKAAGGPVRVALLSFAYGFNGIAAPGGDAWRGNLISEDRIRRDAATARRRGADVVVVSMHWGTEYDQRPNAQQLSMAPRLIGSPDIDLLLGHHVHVVQPLQRIHGEWVVYGLGNLISSHGTAGAPLREGLLVRFGFTERAGGGFEVTSARYAPLLMTSAVPRRVLDVAATRRAGGTANATVGRLDSAWARTTAVVNSRGAKAAGLLPIPTP